MRETEGDLTTEGSDRRQCNDGSRERFEDDMLLTLKIEEGAISQ